MDKRMALCVSECEGDNPVTCVSDEVVLSHYGEQGSFRSEPRPEKERGMSLQIGEWEADELCEHIFGSPPKGHVELADVRYATAGVLRAAGFVVVHTPGRLGSQKDHVTAGWPGPDGELTVFPWPDNAPALFHQCFNGEVKGKATT